MTGGSDDARTPPGERNAVDAAWDELLGGSDEDGDDSGKTSARAVSGSHGAAPARRADADDEMARLMGGDAPKLPPLDPAEAPPVEAAQVEAPPTPRIEAAQVEAPPTPRIEAARIEAAQVEAPKVEAPPTPRIEAAQIEAAKVEAPPTPRIDATPVEPRPVAKVIVREEPKAAAHDEPAARPKAAVAREEPARGSRPSLRVVDLDALPARASEGAARAIRPTEDAPPAPAPARGLPWPWIAVGVLAAGAVAYLAARDRTGPSDRETTHTAAAPVDPPREPPPPRASSSSPGGTDGSDDARGDDDTAAPGDDTGEPKPAPRSGDPREPPPGTPPEIAAVFRHLPVGPADRPPVGGIGATGIHIDHIAMGSEMQGATCRGHTDRFSVAGGDKAGVCVRVVHTREKEELQVLWQKHGGSTRRSKMVVLPMHAYRTRGYLVLRSEYIGDWTVRILSSDGVELARHDFTVVP